MTADELSRPDGAGAELSSLRDLARELARQPGLPEVRQALLSAAREWTAAGEAVLLHQVGDGTLEVVGDPAAHAQLLRIEHLHSPAWGVVLGRTSLRWDASQVPQPFDQLPGWEHGMAVRLPTVGPHARVLAVAAPVAGAFGPDALERLDAVAVLGAAALETRELHAHRERAEELLRAVLDISTRITMAEHPRDVVDELVAGLVTVAGFRAAALWLPDRKGSVTRLRMVAQTGLPPEVATAASELGLDSRHGSLITPRRPLSLRRALEGPAPSDWPGRRLFLVALPRPREGVLGLYHDDPLDSLHHGVLSAMAYAASVALRQTEESQERRQLLRRLTDDLMRGSVPEGVAIGTVYRAATSSSEAFGGDFFDWFVVDPDRLVLTVGDVSGRGVAAASRTSMAVWSLRAYAVHGQGPQLVAHLLDRAVGRYSPPDSFVTMAHLHLDLHSWEGQLVLAGHPPPVLVRAGSCTTMDLPADPPLGLELQSTFSSHPFALDPGDQMVLYTDGVVEARGRGEANRELFGFDRLVAAARTASGGAQSTADAIWAALEQWTERHTQDDVAVVVLQRPAT